MSAPDHTVSVVLPVRNGARFVLSALDSIERQTYRPHEVILVVDPSSTDATVELTTRYADADNRARVVLQKSTGVAGAISEGWLAAAGEFVACLSADDRYTPEALEYHVAALLAAPRAGYSVGMVEYVLDPETGAPPGFRTELLDHPRIARMIETTVVRRSVIELVGKHRASMGVSSDVDWFARANDMGVPTIEVPNVVVHKLVHAASTSHTAAVAPNELLEVARASLLRKRGLVDDRGGPG